MARSGHVPSRRALAAGFKLSGRRPQRRWPFLPAPLDGDLNLGFRDLLEFQHGRSKRFVALVVGAFDGLTNDPAGQFLLERECRAILVEPQPEAFRRLSEAWRGSRGSVETLNAAIDVASGSRVMYGVRPGVEGLPGWTEQLASFSREHVLKHSADVPGLEEHVEARIVPTLSFSDLLDRYGLRSLDLLQTDAEGFDGQLLSWFPFERVKPWLLHYETAHMATPELAATRDRLRELGYVVLPSDSETDDMGVLF